MLERMIKLYIFSKMINNYLNQRQKSFSRNKVKTIIRYLKIEYYNGN